ncbi:hypothetical protein [Paenibacillus sp. W4I10]|uniref:hypothetical protein n=1 Tax=Paenibacillus sp. W4I10 TaxID=3042298 RepID=UPI0027D8DAAF|nr:hypothetical protein [Paenibacillus sp. W4I10]
MIRRYIADKELKVKRYIVGQRGQTPVSLLYLEMGFMQGISVSLIQGSTGRLGERTIPSTF